MSDSDDSNFSEEEDSERSSDGEEAEVCVGDAGGGLAPGDSTRAEGPRGELGGDPSGCGPWELPGCREKVGKPKTSRGTDAGGWGCSRYGEPAGGVFKGPAMW